MARRRDARPPARVQRCETGAAGCMAARAQGRGPRPASSGVDARTGNTERAHEPCANCRPRIAAGCENSRRCSGNFDARSFGQVLSVRSKRRERSCDPSLGPRSSWWPSGASGRLERRGGPTTRSAPVTTDATAVTEAGEIDLECGSPRTGGTILVSGIETFARILRLAASCQQRRDNHMFDGFGSRCTCASHSAD